MELGMTHLQKIRKPSTLKWVYSNFVDSHNIPSWPIVPLFYLGKNNRLYGTKTVVQSENCDELDEASIGDGQRVRRIYGATRGKAQDALLEYLHSTRGLHYMDAENISKNSPHFIGKLLEKVDTEADVGKSITRFLRYHPINEFEPFFESLGLKPHEYSPLLPRDLMFLSDDDLLLENCRVLRNYGVTMNKMGKMYKEAMEIFRYDYGVLKLKLRAYEEFGLSQPFMAKVVVFCPRLLIGDVNVDFIKVLEILKRVGIEFSWTVEHLSENSFYNWSQLCELLNFFSKTGYNEEQLGGLLRQHPGILFEGSGDKALSLIGFLFKFGSTMRQISFMFMQFPQTQVGKFSSNLRQCVLFLNEIKMEVHEIGKIVRSHPLLLGSFTLKKTSSLLSRLNVGKKRLCKFIQDNPQEMKKWVVGSKVEWIPNSGEKLRSKMLKNRFFLDLGFVENSNEMEKILKVVRGTGAELQDRFDCLIKAGLDRKDVCRMVRVSPHILNKKKDVIEMKISFLVNDLGYPISALATFPSYLSYSIERVKLRFAMYNWLKDQGAANPMLRFITIVSCSDQTFFEKYIKSHPKGPEIWQDLKKKFCSG